MKIGTGLKSSLQTLREIYILVKLSEPHIFQTCANSEYSKHTGFWNLSNARESGICQTHAN